MGLFERFMTQTRINYKKRAEVAERLLDDVVVLFGILEKHADTSMVKETKTIIKRRIKEGQTVTAVWPDLLEKELLNENKCPMCEMGRPPHRRCILR